MQIPVNRQHARVGYLYVALAALLFAISGTASKYLFTTGLTAFQLIQLRTTLACAGLLVWLGLRHAPLLRIAIRDLPYFAGLGILGIGSAQFFYLFAISKINVAAAILLHYTGPVFVFLYAVLVQKHKPGALSLLAVCGTLAGCSLMVGAYNLEIVSLNRAGIIGGFLAAIAFAVYSILSEHGMQKYNPWTVLCYGMLFAALMWNVLHPPLAAVFQSYPPDQWLWIGFVGLCGTILPFGLYFEGIQRIASTHASLTATLEPISAGVIAALFLGEVMAPLQMLGGAMVIVSILMLQLSKP
jgi:DME family drug/metabolite transporter